MGVESHALERRLRGAVHPDRQLGIAGPGCRHRDALELDAGLGGIAHPVRQLQRRPVPAQRLRGSSLHQGDIGEEVVGEMLGPQVAARDPHQLARQGPGPLDVAPRHEHLAQAGVGAADEAGDGGAVREEHGALERRLGAGDVTEEEQPPAPVVERDAFLGDGSAPAQDGQACLEALGRTGGIALHCAHGPRDTQASGTLQLIAVRSRERSLQELPALGQVGMVEPEPAQETREGELLAADHRVGAIESQPQFADLAFKGIRLLVAMLVPQRERAGGERHPVADVAPGDRLLLARPPELDPTVLPDRVQQAEPAPAVGANRAERERSVCEPDHRLDRVDVLPAAHGLHGRRWNRRRERGHPPQDGLVGRVEQLVAPVEGGPQRPLAGDRRATAVGQQPEPVVQPVEDVRGLEHPQSRGRHLDREGQPVEPPADLPHGVKVGAAPGSVRAYAAGPVKEQSDGVRHLCAPTREGIGGCRAERGQPPQDLAAQAERFPARREDRHGGGAHEEGLGQPCARLDHVLAVVQDQQAAAHRRCRR